MTRPWYKYKRVWAGGFFCVGTWITAIITACLAPTDSRLQVVGIVVATMGLIPLLVIAGAIGDWTSKSIDRETVALKNIDNFLDRHGLNVIEYGSMRGYIYDAKEATAQFKKVLKGKDISLEYASRGVNK